MATPQAVAIKLESTTFHTSEYDITYSSLGKSSFGSLLAPLRTTSDNSEQNRASLSTPTDQTFGTSDDEECEDDERFSKQSTPTLYLGASTSTQQEQNSNNSFCKNNRKFSDCHQQLNKTTSFRDLSQNFGHGASDNINASVDSMEGLPLSRQTDEFSNFTSALLEPTQHHNHHDGIPMDMGNQMNEYLDPNSFGGSSLDYDEYGQSSSIYGMNHHDTFDKSYDNGDHQTNMMKYEQPTPIQQQQHQQTSFVAQFPVKAVDPMSYGQRNVAPLPPQNINNKPINRKPAAPRQTVSKKQEPVDPMRVEYEVQRNVSQILNASKHHKMTAESQQKTTVAPSIQPVKQVFSCSGCNRQLANARTLQRHRQTCTGLLASPNSNSMPPPMTPSQMGTTASSPLPTQFQMTNTSYNSQTVTNQTYLDNSFDLKINYVKEETSYSNWPQNDINSVPQPAAEQGSSMNDNSMDIKPVIKVDETEKYQEQDSSFERSLSTGLDSELGRPLSLEVDDPLLHSSSTSLSSNSQGTPQNFLCESCKKGVSSMRSLKRHHTTCKQYIAEFGISPEDKPPPKPPTNAPKRVKKPKNGAKLDEDKTSGRVPVTKIIGDVTTSKDVNPAMIKVDNSPKKKATKPKSALLEALSSEPVKVKDIVHNPYASPQMYSYGGYGPSGSNQFYRPTMGPPQQSLNTSQCYPSTSLNRPISYPPINASTWNSSSMPSCSNSQFYPDSFHSVAPSTSNNSANEDVEIKDNKTNNCECGTVHKNGEEECLPKAGLASNKCEDCSRQLCSASNLKRHRATCKAVLQRLSGSTSSSQPSTPLAPSTPITVTAVVTPSVTVDSTISVSTPHTTTVTSNTSSSSNMTSVPSSASQSLTVHVSSSQSSTVQASASNAANPMTSSATVTYTKVNGISGTAWTSTPEKFVSSASPTKPRTSSNVQTEGQSRMYTVQTDKSFVTVGEHLRAQHVNQQKKFHNQKPIGGPNQPMNQNFQSAGQQQTSQMQTMKYQHSMQKQPISSLKSPVKSSFGVVEHQNTESVHITSHPLIPEKHPFLETFSDFGSDDDLDDDDLDDLDLDDLDEEMQKGGDFFNSQQESKIKDKSQSKVDSEPAYTVTTTPSTRPPPPQSTVQASQFQGQMMPVQQNFQRGPQQQHQPQQMVVQQKNQMPLLQQHLQQSNQQPSHSQFQQGSAQNNRQQQQHHQQLPVNHDQHSNQFHQKMQNVNQAINQQPINQQPMNQPAMNQQNMNFGGQMNQQFNPQRVQDQHQFQQQQAVQQYEQPNQFQQSNQMQPIPQIGNTSQSIQKPTSSKSKSSKKPKDVGTTKKSNGVKIEVTPCQSASPLDSIITSEPLPYVKNNEKPNKFEPAIVHNFDPVAIEVTPLTPSKPIKKQQEYQCPECLKLYSCRKNVKRHRMAVHKLTSEDIANKPATPVTPAMAAALQASSSAPPPVAARRHTVTGSAPTVNEIETKGVIGDVNSALSPNPNMQKKFSLQQAPLAQNTEKPQASVQQQLLLQQPQQLQQQYPQQQQPQPQNPQQQPVQQQNQQQQQQYPQQQLQNQMPPPQQFTYQQAPTPQPQQQQQQQPMQNRQVLASPRHSADSMLTSPSWSNSSASTSWRRCRSGELVDDEESKETARIAAELKRSAEEEMAEIEGKKPKPELAEADTTTFTEDNDKYGMTNLPPLSTSSSSGLPSLSSPSNEHQQINQHHQQQQQQPSQQSSQNYPSSSSVYQPMSNVMGSSLPTVSNWNNYDRNHNANQHPQQQQQIQQSHQLSGYISQNAQNSFQGQYSNDQQQVQPVQQMQQQQQYQHHQQKPQQQHQHQQHHNQHSQLKRDSSKMLGNQPQHETDQIKRPKLPPIHLPPIQDHHQQQQQYRMPQQSPMMQHPSQSPMMQHPSQSPMMQHPSQSPMMQHPSQSPMMQHPSQSPMMQHPSQSPMMLQSPIQSHQNQMVPQSPMQQQPPQYPMQQSPLVQQAQSSTISYMPIQQQQQQQPNRQQHYQMPIQSPLNNQPQPIRSDSTMSIQSPMQQPQQQQFQQQPLQQQQQQLQQHQPQIQQHQQQQQQQQFVPNIESLQDGQVAQVLHQPMSCESAQPSSDQVEQKPEVSAQQSCPSGGEESSDNKSDAPVKKKKTHMCSGCQKILSSDYSLRRHRSTCPDVKTMQATKALLSSQKSLDKKSGSRKTISPSDMQLSSDSFKTNQMNETIPKMNAPLLSSAPCTPAPCAPASSIQAPFAPVYSEHSLHLQQFPNGVVEKKKSPSENGEVPDSTTSQRHDRSTSPGLDYLQHDVDFSTGNQIFSSGETLQEEQFDVTTGVVEEKPETPPDPKLLEIITDNPYAPMYATDEMIFRFKDYHRVRLSKRLLANSSNVFANLQLYYPKVDGDFHLTDCTWKKFRVFMDVITKKNGIQAENIDIIIELSRRYQFSELKEVTERFLRFTLPRYSIMHAIRLSDAFKLHEIKQHLFDTMSIDMFRSFRALSSDPNYRLMSSTLKAELLEKWGTFL